MQYFGILALPNMPVQHHKIARPTGPQPHLPPPAWVPPVAREAGGKQAYTHTPRERAIVGLVAGNKYKPKKKKPGSRLFPQKLDPLCGHSNHAPAPPTALLLSCCLICVFVSVPDGWVPRHRRDGLGAHSNQRPAQSIKHFTLLQCQPHPNPRCTYSRSCACTCLLDSSTEGPTVVLCSCIRDSGQAQGHSRTRLSASMRIY